MAKEQPEKPSFLQGLKQLPVAIKFTAKRDKLFVPLAVLAALIPLGIGITLGVLGIGWLWMAAAVMGALLGVMIVLNLRATDRYNDVPLKVPATAQDAPLAFSIPCAATSGPEGANCSLTTTADAVLADVAREGQRAVWELGQVQVYDGGADGDADSTADNTLFAVQGTFAP